MSQPPSIAQITHRIVLSSAGRIHLVEQGSGPLVLLVHGFPEFWYSWRHQLRVSAAAGYRAVAVDVRGDGRSVKPVDVAAYRMLELVEDTVAVVHALGEEMAVIVGHDWDAAIAANSALVRPDVFRGVGLLSVPYAPRAGPRPSEVFARMSAQEEFYVSYFQQPGRAEAEIEPDVRGWLAGFYAALSADSMPPAHAPDPHFVTPSGRLRDRFPTDLLPAWLSEDDLDVYAAGIRTDRHDRSAEPLPEHGPGLGRPRRLRQCPITQPSVFIGGALDASTTWMADAIQAYPLTLPNLLSSHILDGCGHWIQQERPEQVNQILTDWLTALPG